MARASCQLVQGLVAGKARPPEQDLVRASERVEQLPVVRSHRRPVLLDHLFMRCDRLLQLLGRLGVFLGVPLEGNHVLLESLDEPGIVLLPVGRRARGIYARPARLEGLGEQRDALLLNEELQLGDGLRHGALGVVPDSDRIILEPRWQPVLVGKLEHLRLPLTQAVDSLQLTLVDVVQDVLEGSLELGVEAGELVVRKRRLIWLPLDGEAVVGWLVEAEASACDD